jgi:hypothetical protein
LYIDLTRKRSLDGDSLEEIPSFDRDEMSSPHPKEQGLQHGKEIPPSSTRQLPSPVSEQIIESQWDEDADDDTYVEVKHRRDRDERASASLHGQVAPVIFLGFELPLWCSKKPSWTQVSECVARYAPCFIFCSRHFHGTDRAILSRLNILNSIFALVQMGAAIWLCVVSISNVLVSDRQPQYGEIINSQLFIPNLWNPAGSLVCIGVIGLIILSTNLIALRTIREVNLLGAIRYLWIMLWMIPFEIFYTVALFGEFVHIRC